MSTAIGDLVINLLARNQVAKPVMDAQRQMQSFERVTGGVIGRVHGMFASLASVAMPLGGVGMFASAVMGGNEFNTKMRQSQAIMGDLSATMRGEMREAALDVGNSAYAGATQAAEAYYFLASAGLDAKQSIAGLPQVAAFSAAGNFDMARATDLATDAQSALGLTVKDATQNLENLTRVTDVLIRANTLANASAEQFSVALTTKAGAALRTVGKDIEEGVAVLAAWADQGIKGEEAGTAMNIVLRDLQTQALQNAAAFRAAGVAVFDSAGEMRNIADIVADLENRLAGMSDAGKKAALMQLGFADKSIIFIQTLLGTSEKIRGYEAALRSSSGYTKEVADKQIGPLRRGFAYLSTAVTEAGSSLLERLGPGLGSAIGMLGGAIRELSPMITGTIRLAVAIGVLVGALKLINLALAAYTAIQKAAATASVIFQAVTSPAGLVKMTAGLLAASGVLLVLDGAFASSEKSAARAVAATNKLPDSLKRAADTQPGLAGINEELDTMADNSERVSAALTAAGRHAESLISAMAKAGGAAASSTAGVEQFLAERKKIDELGRDRLGYSAAPTDALRLADGMNSGIQAAGSDLAELAKVPGILGAAAEAAATSLGRIALARTELAVTAEELAASEMPIDEQQRQMAEAAERFLAVVQKESGAIEDLREAMAKAVGVFGSVEAAQKAAQKALDSIKTPAETLDETKQKLEAMTLLGLVNAEQHAKLTAKAMEDFDKAIGGPAAKIAELQIEAEGLAKGLSDAQIELLKLGKTPGVTQAQLDQIEALQNANQHKRDERQNQQNAADSITDLQDKVYQLTNGLTDAQMALHKLGQTPGVTPEQLAEFERLQKELQRLQKAEELKKAGQQMMEQFRSPAEQLQADLNRIQELYNADAIDAITKKRAEDAAAEKYAQDQAGPDKPYAGALERGSAEAYSRILEAMGQKEKANDQRAAIDAAKRTAENTAAIAELLRENQDDETEDI